MNINEFMTNEFYKDLTESLQTGFVNKFRPSKREYLPEIITNDKLQGKKVLTTITKELRRCVEYWFSVAFLTKSGVATLINLFQELEQNEIRGKILVSQYQNFTQPEALRTLLQLPSIDLRIAVEGEFHAKGYLFKTHKNYNLVIGSSNLTANALCSNKEWNLKISATPESKLIHDALFSFQQEFDSGVSVDEEFIRDYEKIYDSQKRFFFENEKQIDNFRERKINPNKMQTEALQNLGELRATNKNKALLISATGTGKTFLSAFDVKATFSRKLLFVVHRANIAKAALKSFNKIFGSTKTMGMYSGQQRELNADFIFSTIQTISRDEHLTKFDPKHFDYIVVDETHRAGAPTYQKLINYFEPKFLMGMTATPERTDGFDIFQEFDHNIAYEIRLHHALEEEMLCPFHYYGITDISVDGQILEENADFLLLTSTERVERIIERAKFYGCDDGFVRGLVFCRSIDECKTISREFNLRGYRTVSLVGASSEEERALAIRRLESDDPSEKLDYIFTVDIFNEGVDIPKVNQVIMLRPTQSAIVFVQQLGRGLRKIATKEYLTVIDFIGNYNNNYLIPIALYGDTTYNKDHIRKMMSSGSSLIPGSSTVNFDEISRNKIFEAIDSANLQLYRDLKTDYNLLKFKIGKIPMMMDFVAHGSRDPELFVKYSKSYFNFAARQENELEKKLSDEETKLLELFSNDIANTKRIEEVVILKSLLKNQQVSKSQIKDHVLEKYGFLPSDSTIASCVKNLNFEFITELKGGRLISAKEKYQLSILDEKGDLIILAH